MISFIVPAYNEERLLGATVLTVTHRQIAATRNAGACVARGDVLFFVDADTLVHAALVNMALYARVMVPVVVKLLQAGRLAAGWTGCGETAPGTGAVVRTAPRRPTRGWVSLRAWVQRKTRNRMMMRRIAPPPMYM